MISQRFKPVKTRIAELQDQVTSLRAAVAAATPIPVLSIAPCGHPECGAPVPPAGEIPTDALVVYLGCRHAAPEQLTDTPNPSTYSEASDEPSQAQQDAYQQLLAAAKAPPADRSSKPRLLTR